MFGHMRSSAGMAAAATAGLVIGVAASPAALAEEVDLLKDHGHVSLGTFINGSKLKIRLDGEGGQLGTEVDWDSTFGDDEVNRFRLDGLWRFGERHYLRFLYTDYSTSKTRTFEEEVDWGDVTFPVDAEVRSKLGFEIIELAYEYAFLKRENYEVAGGIGLHYTTFDASLSADVVIDEETGATEQRSGSASVDAPLPVLGVHGLWNIGKNFYLDGHIQYFALAIDEYDGSIINYRAALIWQPKKYIGIGAGYDLFDIDVDVEKDKFNGSMEWQYSGPQIFFNVGF